MSAEKKGGLRAWWSRVNKVKLTIWAVVILAAGLGFLRQYIIHTDGYIKGFIEKNKAEYSAAAQLLMERPTSSADFTSTLSSQVKQLNKFSLDLLEDSPVYKDSREVLEKVGRLGVQDVKSTDSVVRFYQSARFVVIYAPGKDSVDGASPAGDGWFYIRSF